MTRIAFRLFFFADFPGFDVTLHRYPCVQRRHPGIMRQNFFQNFASLCGGIHCDGEMNDKIYRLERSCAQLSASLHVIV